LAAPGEFIQCMFDMGTCTNEHVGVHAVPLSLNLNLVVALDALLAERSVTRAARRIGLSQSAMSHALARLRVAFADPLLVRTPTGMQPTRRAASIAPRLARCLVELGGLLGDGGAFDPATAHGEVVIATGDFVAAYVAPRLAARLATASPQLRVRFVGLDVAGLAAALRAGDVDLAVGPAGGATADVATAPFATIPYACGARRGHPALAGRMTLARYAALAHVQIAPSGRGGSLVDRALAARGFERRVAVRVESFLVAPLVVATSELVLTAPDLVFEATAAGGRVVTFRPPFAIEPLALRLAWDARRGGDPRLAWIRAELASLAP
jgi:DNA-binding transcriptional LysR family regulator